MKLYVAHDNVKNHIIGEYPSEEQRIDAVAEYYSHYFTDSFELVRAIFENTFYYTVYEDGLGEL